MWLLGQIFEIILLILAILGSMAALGFAILYWDYVARVIKVAPFVALFMIWAHTLFANPEAAIAIAAFAVFFVAMVFGTFWTIERLKELAVDLLRSMGIMQPAPIPEETEATEETSHVS